MGAGEGEVIDLAEEQNAFTSNGGRVNGAIMGGGLETQLGREQDGIDVGLPEAARFRVSLKGMKDGQNLGAVNILTMAFLIPIGVGVVNGDKSGCLGWRGVGIGILGIATVDFVTKLGSEGKEKSLDGLLNTGGVCGCNAMENGGRFRGTITTVAGAAGPITFNRILPVGPEDNGLVRFRNRGAKHAESMEMIKLLVFAVAPFRPGGEVFKLATRKTSKSLFSGGNGLGLNGLEENANLFGGDRVFGEVNIWVTEGRNGSYISNSKGGDVVIIVNVMGLEDVVFKESATEVLGIKAAFGGQFKGDSRGIGIKMVAKSQDGLVLSKHRSVADFDNVGTTNLVTSGFVRTVEFGDTTVALDVRDVGTVGQLVSRDRDTIGGVLAFDLHMTSQGVREGVGGKIKLIDGRLGGFGREGITLLEALEMNNIGGYSLSGQVVHALIKTSMLGSFDTFCFRVIPNNIFGGVREEAQEDAFA